jgi:fatty-acyl-CoA synthase
MASNQQPGTLLGQMMDCPLLISGILSSAARHHQQCQIISKRIEGDIHRYNTQNLELRAKKLAQALQQFNFEQGTRVATLAWNGYRHLEIYYGLSGSGLVCHTINPRLFQEQIAYIIEHAQDQMVFFDLSFKGLVDQLKLLCPSVKHWVCLMDEHQALGDDSGFINYECLIAEQSGEYNWPVFDERTASSLCYTSGTTGNPKGALYSHRSTVLHSYATALPDALSLSALDTIMPVVPMFHVNAWGLPYSSLLVGANLVLPGNQLDGQSLYQMIESHGVTFSAGVPTVWAGLLQYMTTHHLEFSKFKRVLIGGSACPPNMMATFKDYGVDVIHAWGMTELSPLGTVARLKNIDSSKSMDDQEKILQKQGRVIFGVDMKIVDQQGQSLPHDGLAFGDLHVKGPWVIQNYFQANQPTLIEDWFPTGDVANIDPDGHMQITDRSKDVIKSGGEWISSIEIENIAAGHPDVMMAACIAIAHPKWDERPLLIIEKSPHVNMSDEFLKLNILEFLNGKIAKWWMPDDVVFIQKIPLTATGKMQKLKLREQFKHFQFQSK